MAVTSFVARAFGASGRGNMTQGAGGSVVEVKRFRTIWRAICSSPSDDAEVVFDFLKANKGTYPWYGKNYSFGNGTTSESTVENIDIEVVDGSDRALDVTFSYEPASANVTTEEQQPGTGGSPTGNPLEWMEDIDVYFTQTLRTFEKGIFRGFKTADGVDVGPHPVMFKDRVLPVTNSVRVPYDPPLESDKNIKVIRIARNVLDYDSATFDQFQDTVNSENITIDKPFYHFRQTIAALTGRIRIGGTFQFANGIKFWRQTAEIQIDYDNWRRKPLDKGLSAIDPAGDPSPTDFEQPIANRDTEDFPLPEPFLLDGLGRRLADGKPPVFGHWTDLTEKSWAGLAGKAW